MHRHPPEIVYADPAIQLMRWDDLFVTRYVGNAGEAHVRRMLEEHVRFVESRPLRTTLSLNHVDVASFQPPNEKVRGLAREYDAAVAPKLRGSATVIAAGGFGGAVVRGILSSLSLINRRQTPQDVFSSVRSAFLFLTQHRAPSPKSPTLPIDDLVAAYDRACGKS
jgi:hypothetical protein